MAKKRKSRVSPLEVAYIVVIVVIAFSVSTRWVSRGHDNLYSDKPFSMEVLNGSGEKGAASRVAVALRKMGIDVLIVGNADRFDYNSSVLIDRRGNPELMRRLSRMIGVDNVIQQKVEKPLVDATLIVGEDVRDLRIAVEGR